MLGSSPTVTERMRGKRARETAAVRLAGASRLFSFGNGL